MNQKLWHDEWCYSYGRDLQLLQSGVKCNTLTHDSTVFGRRSTAKLRGWIEPTRQTNSAMKRHWRNWSHDDEGEGLPDSDSDTRSSRRFSLTRLMAIFLFSLFLFSLIFLLPHPPIQSASTAKTLHQFKQTQQGSFL